MQRFKGAGRPRRRNAETRGSVLRWEDHLYIYIFILHTILYGSIQNNAINAVSKKLEVISSKVDTRAKHHLGLACTDPFKLAMQFAALHVQCRAAFRLVSLVKYELGGIDACLCRYFACQKTPQAFSLLLAPCLLGV